VPAWPWPPPLSFAVLRELSAALRASRDAVPEAERGAFDAAPIDWCVVHPTPGRELLRQATEAMRGFEFFRRFPPGS
jgi:hypothetical protein